MPPRGRKARKVQPKALETVQEDGPGATIPHQDETAVQQQSQQQEEQRQQQQKQQLKEELEAKLQEGDEQVEQMAADMWRAACEDVERMRQDFKVKCVNIPKKVREMSLATLFGLDSEESQQTSLTQLQALLDKLPGAEGSTEPATNQAAAGTAATVSTAVAEAPIPARAAGSKRAATAASDMDVEGAVPGTSDATVLQATTRVTRRTAARTGQTALLSLPATTSTRRTRAATRQGAAPAPVLEEAVTTEAPAAVLPQVPTASSAITEQQGPTGTAIAQPLEPAVKGAVKRRGGRGGARAAAPSDLDVKAECAEEQQGQEQNKSTAASASISRQPLQVLDANLAQLGGGMQSPPGAATTTLKPQAPATTPLAPVAPVPGPQAPHTAMPVQTTAASAMPGGLHVLGGFTLVRKQAVKGRTRATRGAKAVPDNAFSVVVSTTSGVNYTVDAENWVQNVPEGDREDIQRQLEQLHLFTAAALKRRA